MNLLAIVNQGGVPSGWLGVGFKGGFFFRGRCFGSGYGGLMSRVLGGK